ncbi:MAG: hypothetical protein GEU88_17645 [Solirubrobacterales bacterium]|nr:hypothetical protein [Solirubrobacterales bacterium]
MPLTPDQRAMLQLLLERDQGYAELATLLGVERAEVSARARAALTSLGGADPDRNVGLTDYLLGQADPIGRADASRHLRDDASDRALATTLVERLRELYPEARLPRLPGEPRSGRILGRARGGPSEAAEPRARRRVRTGGLSRSQTRLLVVLGSAAVLVVAVVLAVTGVFGDGEDSRAASAQPTSTTAAATADERIQRVALRPPDGGGDATGEAVFGVASGDQPFVELSIEGLDPAPQGETYVIWMMLTGDKGYPLSPITVTEQGTYADRFPIPAAVLPVIARVHTVEVAIASVKEVRKTVRSAIDETSLVLDRPGATVLRGKIPAGQQRGQGSGSS